MRTKSVLTFLSLDTPSRPASASREAKNMQADTSECIQVVQSICPRGYPHHDLSQAERPRSWSWMSDRVYAPRPPLARGATHSRSAKFGGKVQPNAAGEMQERPP
jgi:hypothetical protein